MAEPTHALRDRAEAGRELAVQLSRLDTEAPLVLALPRGGVPVGFEISQRLRAPLDVLVVRKIGAPGNVEYGLGAITEDGTYFLDEDRVREAGYSVADLGPVIQRERAETERRTKLYRSGRRAIERRDRTVVLVDDGAATGGTLLAAIRLSRLQGVRRLVVALGVAPMDTCRLLEREVDELVVLRRPAMFYAVGQFYLHFDPVEDAEVLDLLRRAAAHTPE